MWGRRRKRGTRLSRLLALGRLEEAMARAEQQQEEEEEGEPEAVPYPPAGHPAPDVPVDNSAAPQYHQELPVQRTCDSTRHGSFG
jgi:hypothetical protein